MTQIIIGGVPYKLSCTMADCDKDLHSFRTNITLQRKGIEKGCCRYCKSSLINWERLYKRDFDDFEYTKSALKYEMIRTVFWSIKQPNSEMVKKVTSLSPDKLDEKINLRLRTTLSKPKSQNMYDGRQTPIDDDNLIHWAQHATGTCCRGCLEEWYGIDTEDQMSNADYEYFKNVIKAYLNDIIFEYSNEENKKV